MFIDGQDGNNTLLLNDKDDPRTDILTIRADQLGTDLGDLFFGPGGQLRYSSMRQLYLFAGAGGNQIDVVSTDGHTRQVGIYGGLLDDSVTVGGMDLLGNVTVSQIHSDVAVHGQGGADSVLVADADASAPARVTVTATQVGADQHDTFFGGGGSLTYDGLTMLTADARMGGD